MLNSRDIDRLRPDVAANCRAWLELCRAAGLLVLVTGTVRDEEYQQYCFENGTAATPVPSFHGEQAGLAFDFCQNIKGQEYSDSAFFQRAGELGMENTHFANCTGLDDEAGPDVHYTTARDIAIMSRQLLGHDRIREYTTIWMPPYREEDTDMTKEEIQAMIDAAVTAARPPVYTSVENCPAWARETVQKAVDEGVLRGDQGGGLRLTDDNLVNLQMLRNLGLLDGGGI